jgi:peptidoglycan hydrolase CwlO-like protein
MKKIIIRLIALFMMVILIGSVSISAYALTTQEKIDQAEQQKKDAEGKLSNTKNNIGDMQDKQGALQKTLGNLNDQLTQVGNNLATLEDQISTKEKEITQTKSELEKAKQTADDQYAAMKKRIQYMYENGRFEMFDMMLNMNNYSDMLNYMDYVNALSAYDREKLTEYKKTRDEVAEKEKELETEQKDLADKKVKEEAEQSRVNGLVSSTSKNIVQYKGQISTAEAAAEAYEAQITAQESNINTLKKQLAEEIAMSKLSAQSAKRDISQVTFAEGDRYLLASLIYCEAGGEPYAGKLGVGSVVINRVLSSVYPNTVTGVIYQARQFTPVASGRFAIALASGSATASCYQAADEAMAGVSNVGNCVYFRTPIPGLTGISIGGHIFY